MTKKDKNYLLYADKEQTKLLAQAYSLQEAKETSLEYTEGHWFSYEDINNVLENERKVNIKFGAAEKEKEIYVDDTEWSLGGSDIR